MMPVSRPPPVLHISCHGPSLFKLSAGCCFFPLSMHPWQYPILAQSNLFMTLPKTMTQDVFKEKRERHAARGQSHLFL